MDKPVIYMLKGIYVIMVKIIKSVDLDTFGVDRKI